MGRYFFGGVNTTGKSTLAVEIQATRPGVEIIHTTGAIMDLLGIRSGYVDTLRALPEDFKRQKNDELLTSLLERPAHPDTLTIFDSHYLNIIDGVAAPCIDGVWPAQIDGLVLVEAEAETLYRRVQADHKERRLLPDGVRGHQALHLLNSYREQTRNEFNRLLGKFALPGIIIQNPDEQLGDAANCFLEFDKQVQTGYFNV